MTLHRRILHRGLVALALCALSVPSFGHGDEPHGDAPHDAAAADASPLAPRLEAVTDSFEMVARLRADALVLYLNRFETGEPVLEANVEIEAGGRTAIADYQADQGSYEVRDAAFLRELSQPGTHLLVATVASGKEADLLTASLTVAAVEHDDGTGDRAVSRAFPALAGFLVAAAAGAGALQMRRRNPRSGRAR